MKAALLIVLSSLFLLEFCCLTVGFWNLNPMSYFFFGMIPTSVDMEREVLLSSK